MLLAGWTSSWTLVGRLVALEQIRQGYISELIVPFIYSLTRLFGVAKIKGGALFRCRTPPSCCHCLRDESVLILPRDLTHETTLMALCATGRFTVETPHLSLHWPLLPWVSVTFIYCFRKGWSAKRFASMTSTQILPSLSARALHGNGYANVFDSNHQTLLC